MGLIIKNKTKYVGGPNSAKYVEYNNTESQLEASNVQEAIDLLAQGAGGGNALEMVLTQAEYDALGDEKYTDDITYYITDAAEFDADNVGYNNIESGLEAVTVQDALDEMLIKIDSGSGAGEDGKSAYEIWLEIEGNEGKTVEEFLASLKGPKGEKGDTPELTGYLKDTDDTQNNVVGFTSNDNVNPTEWNDIEVLSSGEKHSSLFNKISTMFKNIRYLFKMLGTDNISAIGNGTVKGAISTLNSDLDIVTNRLNQYTIGHNASITITFSDAVEGLLSTGVTANTGGYTNFSFFSLQRITQITDIYTITGDNAKLTIEGIQNGIKVTNNNASIIRVSVLLMRDVEVTFV